jgi:hypothetical protein
LILVEALLSRRVFYLNFLINIKTIAIKPNVPKRNKPIIAPNNSLANSIIISSSSFIGYLFWFIISNILSASILSLSFSSLDKS